MSKGLDAAREFGERLPRFSNLAEAEPALFRERDRVLDLLRAASRVRPGFAFDLSPASLKQLEPWYFSSVEGPGAEAAGLDRTTLEWAVAMYFGAVVVQHCPPFAWVVTEFPFLAGRYEIGIERPLYRRSLTLGIDLTARPNNRRQQSLWRDYRACARGDGG